MDKSFLKGRDYSELKWRAIATQRRYDEPAGGYANLPEMQVIFQVKGEEAGGMRMAARSDMDSIYGKKQVDHDIRVHTKRYKRAPPTAPTRNLNAIMYEEMRDGGGGESDVEDTYEGSGPDDSDDVIYGGSEDTKLLTNAEAREEDPSLEEFSALLQKMMRGEGKTRQRLGQTRTRIKRQLQAPESPIPSNRLKAQELEMQILEAQKKLERYKQLQSAS